MYRVIGAILIAAYTTHVSESAVPAIDPQVTRTIRDPVVMRADSLLAIGDSAGAIRVLESVLFPRSTNAAAWHRYGQLRWQRVASKRSGGFISDANVIASLRMADSALRLATQFAPNEAQYWVTLGRFNLQSGVGSMRFAAERQMQNAFGAALAAGDSMRMGESADELGRAIWYRYEATANRAMVSAGQRVQLQTQPRWRRGLGKDFLSSFAKKIEPPTGRADLELALRQFRAATAAAPVQLKYSRHLFMVLATDRRWEELLSVATRRAAASAFDAQAHFARGVALHRMHRPRDARAAFDEALQIVSDDERADLLRLDRLLAPGANVMTGQRGLDTAAFRAMPLAERDAVSALYWALNDPLSETTENEAYLEFLTRVLQADWRWTDEDHGLRGADTDRGDVFIRYGPPDDEMTLLGNSSVQQDVSASATPDDDFSGAGSAAGGMLSTSQDVGATIAWLYRSGDVFFFDYAPGFGTARTSLTDQQYVRDVATVKPVSWANLGGPRFVDSMAVRTTRFRATNDSADVVFASRLVVDSLIPDMKANAKLDAQNRATLNVHLRLIDGAARTFGVDTTTVRTSTDVISNGAALSWVKRVGRGTSYAKFDALNTEANRAANALVPVTVARDIGFGISDILLVRTNAPASVPPNVSARWRDLHVEPSSGVYLVGEKVSVAWETYELANRTNADSTATNHYRVRITVNRLKRSGAREFAVRVLDGVGAVLNQGRGESDRVILTFDRTGASRDIRVDYVTLDWIGESRGEYALKLELTDLVSNRTAVRETQFRIK